MSAVALVSDLIFSTKIKSTADQLGLPLSLVRTAQALQDAAGGGANMAIIDLNAEGLDPIEAIRQCKAQAATVQTQPSRNEQAEGEDGGGNTARPPVVIAFASHVQRDLIQAAEQAGADLVLPRSRFSAELPDLLQRYGHMGDHR